MMSAVCCPAQTNQPATPTPVWEYSTNQVHMTAYLSNAAVAVGSNIDVFVRISNRSTNELGVLRPEFGDQNLPRLTIDLISGSGLVCNLNPDKGRRMLPQLPIPIFDKATNEWKVPVDIMTNIEPGSYKLRLTQPVYFMLGDYNQNFELKAELELEVK